MTESRKLRVFLCHSSQDKPIVRELHQRLYNENWIDPWLDEEKLLPGQDWDMEIEKAVEASDVVIVCVSSNSVSKEGYIQRELKFVLDIALEKPEGTIFIIPLRLDACDLPRRLRSWQYVDYFPTSQRERSYQRLLQSLKIRFGDSGNQTVNILPAENKPQQPDHVTVSLPTTSTGIFDLGWSILPIIFFAMMVLYGFGYTDSDFELLIGLVGILTSLVLILKRQIADNKFIKFSTIFFVIAHSLWIYSEYTGWDNKDLFLIIDGIAAFLTFGSRLLNFQSPRKHGTYSSIFLTLFITLFSIELIINFFNIYTSEIQTPMIVLGLIAAIFLWFEQ
jgi:hypothetical protein